MNNAVIWDIETHFLPHRKHISATEPSMLRFEVFTAVTMENAVFCDIKTQFVPHRRHVSATESSRLMVCNI
jgi:hypothetical protein